MTKDIVKALRATDNGFYSPLKALSYGRPAIITTGHRSGGKSTGWARYLLLNYIYNGEKFIYIRRRRDELDLTKRKFFDNAIQILNDAKLGFKIVYFDCEAGRYKITIDKDGASYNFDIPDDADEEEIAELRAKDIKQRAGDCGGAINLAGSQKVKSGYDFTGVTTLIFDEFIAEHQTDYLGSHETPDIEYQNLISLFMSCDRGIGQFFRNETKVILIGNKANVYNPILLKWRVNKYLGMSPEAKFIAPKDEGWIYEAVEPSEKYKQEARESSAYLLMDEAERAYNLGNKARAGNEGSEWVMEVPKQAYYCKGVLLNGKGYGVYEYNGITYIGRYQEGKRSSAYDIASASRHDANLIVTNWKQDPVMFKIWYKFTRKQLFFYNQESAREFLQYLQFIPK